jgi:AAA family ATP:ADP antiporter
MARPSDDETVSFHDHPLDYVLRLFSDVRKGEAGTALLLTLNVFILLTAYYFLKSAREPLILEGPGHHGAEVKSYASAGQAMMLVVLGSLYGWLARHVSRIKLIVIVSLFFVSNLVVFWSLGIGGAPLGVPFYLWVGCYTLMINAQFWAFAADIYSEEQGKRLFPIVGIGATFGSIFGAWLANQLSKHGVSAYLLMLGAAGLLLCATALTFTVHVRESKRESSRPDDDHHDEKLGGKNGWSYLISDKYLLALGILILVLNLVNSNGEYLLDRTLTEAAEKIAEADRQQYVQVFKSSYLLWTNVVSGVVQLFIASRVIKYLGVKGALFVMPVISLVGYGILAVIPVLHMALYVKIAENGIDYSLENTAWQSLWLVVSRDAKYKTKQLTDGFLVRMGDVCSAGVVLLGNHVLSFNTRAFVVVNVVLVLVWIAAVFYIGRLHSERKDDVPAQAVGAAA